MNEQKRQILQIMRKLEEEELEANMAIVAKKLGKDYEDSQFQKAIEELVTEGIIGFTDSINAKII